MCAFITTTLPAGAGDQTLFGMRRERIRQHVLRPRAPAVRARHHARGAVLGREVVQHPHRVADPVARARRRWRPCPRAAAAPRRCADRPSARSGCSTCSRRRARGGRTPRTRGSTIAARKTSPLSTRFARRRVRLRLELAAGASPSSSKSEWIDRASPRGVPQAACILRGERIPVRLEELGASVHHVPASFQPGSMREWRAGPRGAPDRWRFPSPVSGAVGMQPIARPAGGAVRADRPSLSAPVCGSRVAASKSATPSNRPPVRMNSLIALRFASFSGVPEAVVAPRLEVMVAPTTRTRPWAGTGARLPSARRSIAFGTGRRPKVVDAFQPDHRCDAGQAEHVTIEPLQRRRAAGKRRGRANPGGPDIRLPPIPAFTTATRSPYAACSRRDRTSGHRSSPFRVEAVPSVIESPKHTTTPCPTAPSRRWRRGRYHDVEVYGNAPSPRSAP